MLFSLFWCREIIRWVVNFILGLVPGPTSLSLSLSQLYIYIYIHYIIHKAPKKWCHKAEFGSVFTKLVQTLVSIRSATIAVNMPIAVWIKTSALLFLLFSLHTMMRTKIHYILPSFLFFFLLIAPRYLEWVLIIGHN